MSGSKPCSFLPAVNDHHRQSKKQPYRESDHAALKKLITPMRGFKSFDSAKDALRAIEAVRMIKRGHVVNKAPGVIGEICFIENLFEKAE
ncbi:MAG: DDE-type integrase/transposase/recombinase [Nitratireductor sp.]|nr:DDE-type integrase/transposase/recombinase [Nitratireductor sp.]